MPRCGKLLPPIEPHENDEFLAAFVGSAAEDAVRRAPATQLCGSHDEARQWVQTEAIGLLLGAIVPVVEASRPAATRTSISSAWLMVYHLPLSRQA
jgi:hypothetical protein